MRFDAGRVIEFVQALDEPRDAGTEGERRAADLVTDELERVGWKVEEHRVVGSRWPTRLRPWVEWIGLGAWMTLGLALVSVHPDRFRLIAIVTMVLPSLFSSSIEDLLWRRWRGLWPARVETKNILATRPAGEAAPVRVVFLAELNGGSRDRPTGYRTRGWAMMEWFLVFLVVICSVYFLDGWIRRHPEAVRALGWIALGLIWTSSILSAARTNWRRRDPRIDDNRTGLALLLELARTWPERLDTRIESRFVVTGGQWLGQAGARSLVRMIRSEWPRKPTLVIHFHAPGLGPTVEIASEARPFWADVAARELWIPHRILAPYHIVRDFWPDHERTPELIDINGDSTVKGTAKVDPEALGRTAQLATEIALRWARRAAEAHSNAR